MSFHQGTWQHGRVVDWLPPFQRGVFAPMWKHIIIDILVQAGLHGVKVVHVLCLAFASSLAMFVQFEASFLKWGWSVSLHFAQNKIYIFIFNNWQAFTYSICGALIPEYASKISASHLAVVLCRQRVDVRLIHSVFRALVFLMSEVIVCSVQVTSHTSNFQALFSNQFSC